MSNPPVTFHSSYHPPARVDEATFIGIAWGGVALAGLFFLGRISARVAVFQQLFWDDLLVFLAWCMFLANTIIWQFNKGKLYENLGVISGDIFPPPASLPQDTEAYLKASLVVYLFFYSSLWFIKFSFLVFFRPLGYQVKGQNTLWWTVTAITIASWLASIGTIEFACLIRSFDYIWNKCGTRQAIRYQHQVLIYNMVMDVVTDALIIVIPVNLLWNVRISVRQKFALLGLFSLTIFIMIFAIVRVTVIFSWSYQADESWLFMWSSIEQTVSIIVACLASFRALFTKKDATGRHTRTTYGSKNSWTKSLPSLFKFNNLRTKSSTQEHLPGPEEYPYESSMKKRSTGPQSSSNISSSRERLPNTDTSSYELESKHSIQSSHRKLPRASNRPDNVQPLQSAHVKAESQNTASSLRSHTDATRATRPWGSTALGNYLDI